MVQECEKFVLKCFKFTREKRTKKHGTCLRKKLAGKVSPNFRRWSNKHLKMNFKTKLTKLLHTPLGKIAPKRVGFFGEKKY